MIKKIGSDFFYKESSDNTLAWAKEYLDTAQDGAVFIAHELTRARGRQGRVWHWAPGQLALTFVLKPSFAPNEDDLTKLSMALACGIYQAITQYGVTLKWPNDFVINQKKVGGMLMELVWDSNTLRGIIFAFGLNVNNTFEPTHELAELATSLCVQNSNPACPEPVEGPALQETILTSLDSWYQAWYSRAYDHIFATWVAAQSYLGKTITVHKKDGSTITGIAHHLLPNGTLCLKVGNEKLVLSFHDVDFLRL
ncbi:biotin--[acetyl-CoA-carboxylase] ligase [Candidatus Babeliales bacterium]|nr:biotin--[acetyl-CoA-carboxylase] ligase [Candidatus Babeliales bacterium]